MTLRSAPDLICPACAGKGLVLFYGVHSVPVDCTAVFENQEEALKIPHGDLCLGLCEGCGYIHNTVFDPSLLESRGSYEDQQSYSATFQKYAEGLAEDLIRRYNLHNKLIVEIGCGKGDFLEILCSKGRNQGIGIDPIAPEVHDNPQSSNIRFLNELYGVDHGRLRADLICCRHTLEHIYYPAEFVSTIRRSIASDLDTPVYFELPDVTRILDETAFWDIYFEHCSYYGPGALAALFRRNGFEVSELQRGYHNQQLLLHAVPNRSGEKAKFGPEETQAELGEKIKHFSLELKSQIEHWKNVFSMMANQNKRAVIWGSGSKCTGFMTTLSIENEIEYVVDINPRRHDKYIPKFGKKIVSPEFLKQYRPDVVIIMNAVYLKEIQRDLNSMGLNPEVMAV
jgi:SAM-dependent methyltransferase